MLLKVSKRKPSHLRDSRVRKFIFAGRKCKVNVEVKQARRDLYGSLAKLTIIGSSACVQDGGHRRGVQDTLGLKKGNRDSDILFLSKWASRPFKPASNISFLPRQQHLIVTP